MKTVTIQSNKDLFVYGTCYTENKGTEQKPMNLNTTTWLRTKILIQSGTHEYPTEILEWKTVKELVKNNVLFVGEIHDGTADPKLEEAVEAKNEADVLEKQEIVANEKARRHKQKLNDLAEAATESQIASLLKEGK